jgi:hypothetical protein
MGISKPWKTYMAQNNDFLPLSNQSLGYGADVFRIILHSCRLEAQPLLRREEIDGECWEAFGA